MNLLTDGIQNESVLKTDQVVKLTVDGETTNYPVYRVRLDNLYFNDQNARIATWISQYKAEHGENSLSRDNLEHYNGVIHGFIEKSNPEKMKSTQQNIKLLNQQKFGVVLADGRIIDGNRRYTCLRNLAKESENFNYFETVILDRDFQHSAKQIKMLELQIQIGSEERVDYDPIDKLIGIYRDIKDSGLLTEDEYARSTNQSPNAVGKELGKAELLVEFLDAINAPKQYYLARELQLYYPIEELYAALNNVSDEDKKQELKYTAFLNILMEPAGDMTRFIRNLKGIAKSIYLDEYLDSEAEMVETVLDNLSNKEKVTVEEINELRKDKKIPDTLDRNMKKIIDKVKIKESREQPNKMITKAIDALQAIDLELLETLLENKRLSDEQIDNMKSNLDTLDEVFDEVKNKLNDKLNQY